MLRHYGADRVAILDGGLAKWRAEGRPLEQGRRPRAARASTRSSAATVVTKAMLVDGVGSPILDARGRARFDGSAPDPRPGVAAGHIPGARNLPFGDLYRDDGTLKSDERLARRVRRGRGRPALAVRRHLRLGRDRHSLLFAARRLGGRDARLYDGSWSEWGADPATPKANGAGLEAEQLVEFAQASAKLALERSSAAGWGGLPRVLLARDRFEPRRGGAGDRAPSARRSSAGPARSPRGNRARAALRCRGGWRPCPRPVRRRPARGGCSPAAPPPRHRGRALRSRATRGRSGSSPLSVTAR